jgi:hypothetical protein
MVVGPHVLGQNITATQCMVEKLLHLIANRSRKSKEHWGSGITFKDMPPVPLTPYLLNFLKLSKIVPPAGDQAFNT